MMRFRLEDLRSFSVTTLLALGASAEESQMLTDCLIDAQGRTAYHQHQGVARLATYARRFRAGGITLGAPLKVLRQTSSTALVDGGNNIGQVVSVRSMRMAIDKARHEGTGIVSARHSNHFGAASYYSLMAAYEGLVGLAFSIAGPEMPAWGGAVPLVGTNPWSVAVPRRSGKPIVLDLMNSVADKGLFQHMATLGQPLPSTWAVDPQGRTVTDPTAAADALPLPIGGYKGYGIAVMVALLTGGLSGGRIGSAVTSPYQVDKAQGTSHLFVALDPQAFGGLGVLQDGAAALEDELRSSPRLPGVDAILLPGDPEWARLEDARANGTEIPDERVDQLRGLAAEIGVPFPEPLAT